MTVSADSKPSEITYISIRNNSNTQRNATNHNIGTLAATGTWRSKAHTEKWGSLQTHEK